jgi:hypothetical protein
MGGINQGWETIDFFEKIKKKLIFLFKSIFLFESQNLNVYFQYFQHEINFQDFRT